MMQQMILITAVWAISAVTLIAGGENVPFQVGERLSYQIFWGPFVAGRATLRVDGIETVDGNDCYHLIAEAHTSGLADFLFHVQNKTESWLDVDELCTRRYREARTEGKHSRAGETRYDYINHTTLTTNFITGRIKNGPLTAPVQDVISSLYYVRTQPLALDLDNNFFINVSGSNYNVNIRPDLRKMMYFRPTGDVPALRIEPKPTLTIVSANKGRMWFWISDDARKLPLLISSDLKIGSAKLVLNGIASGH